MDVRLSPDAFLSFHLVHNVSSNSHLFFSILFSHLFSFSLLICACVLPLSTGADLASHVAADDALLFLGIPEVSRDDIVFFILSFSHALHIPSSHL